MTFPQRASKFELGKIDLSLLAESRLVERDVIDALDRHQSGDWGEVSADHQVANDAALKDGGSLFSIYRDREGTKFCIGTWTERDKTVVFLFEDY